jgi:hypothetical protein
MVPVVLVNPGTPKMAKKKSGKGKKRRRNPSIPWKGLGLAALGGMAIGAARFAGEMSGLSDGWLGGITLAVGAGAGALTSMASPMAGAGLLGAGVGLGGKDILSATVTLPAATSTSSGTTKTMGMVFSAPQMNAVIDERFAQLMAARSGGVAPGARSQASQFSRAAA